jgi:hypothetical protein
MRTSTTRATSAAALLVLALGVGGCGNGDDAKASKAISDSLMSSSAQKGTQFLDLKRKEADCIGDGFVDRIGTDQLKTYGLVTKDLKADKLVTGVKMSAADAKSATGVLFDCTDVTSMMKKTVGKSPGTSKAVQTCLNKALNEATLRTVFTSVFQGDQDGATKALTKPMTSCMSGSAG